MKFYLGKISIWTILLAVLFVSFLSIQIPEVKAQTANFNILSEPCRTNGTCSDQDRTYLTQLISYCNRSTNTCTSEQKEILKKAGGAQIGEKFLPNNSTNTNGGDDFGCGASSFTSGRGAAICVSSLVYYIGPGLASNVAYVGAYFFSYTVSLSLNSVAYALDFLSSGWTTVRDLANMAFILILVYIAFMIMFQAETTGTIKMLALVIFIALIINFSFFLTRVVIDAGNILAVQFYNAIPQTTESTLSGTTQLSAFGGSGVKDLSYSVMQAVGLQGLFSTASFEAAQKAAGDSVTGGLIILSLIYLSVAVMFWILFFVFLQVGIKFLLRIVILWFLIIAAPLALVAKAVPRGSVQKYYDTWQSYLIKFSFYPAIFLFIYLILIKFIQQMLVGQSGDLVSTIFSGQTVQAAAGASQSVANFGVAGAIANVSIRMGFVIAMFYIALKASDWIVTEGSNMAHNLTGKLTGATLGTAAFAGRVGLGGVIGGTIARQDKLANGGLLARGLWNTGRFLNKRTYDVRNVPGTKAAFGKLGGDVIKGRTLEVGKGHTQTAQTMEKKVEAFGEWFRGPSEAALKDKKELNDRVAAVKAKKEMKRMGVLNEYDIPKIESDLEKIDKDIKRHEDLFNKGLASLSPKELAEYTKLNSANLRDKKREIEAKKATVENTEGKNWDELRTEQAKLSKAAEGLSTSVVTSLKASDIVGIIKQINDSHLKAIKESGKYTAAAVKEINTKWHQENKKAPLAESKKQLDELGKIRDLLEEKGMAAADINSKLALVHTNTRSGNTVTIDLKTAENMKKEVTALKDEQEDLRRNDPDRAIRTVAGQRERELKKAEANLEKLIEKIKDIPEDVGSEGAPMAFKHEAKVV